jgi:hypothetical protein
VPGFLPLRFPPPSSRESHRTIKWLTGATKWHQAQINLCCTKYTGGCRAQPCDGEPHHRFPPNGTRSPGVSPVAGASLMRASRTHHDFHDWQSYVRLRSVDGFPNPLFRSARNCGPVRWELEHGRGDYQRPLWEHPYRPRNKPWSSVLDWWRFRRSSDSASWAHFHLRACPNECGGWAAYGPRDGTLQ